MKSKVFYKMPEMTARNVGGFLKVWKHIGLVLLAVLFTTNLFATVGPPNPIQGPTNVCLGSTIFLTDDSPGGEWGIDNSSIAFVNPDGSVHGNGTGQAVVSYTTVGGTATTTITVNPVPGPTFLVGGGGSTCSGGGVPITLTPSQLGISYQVYVNGSPIGSPVTGTNSPLNFGLFTTPGTYTIKGTNGFGCSSWMTGSVTVTNSGPTAFAEQGILECGGTTTVFVGANGGQPPYSGTGEFTGVGAGIHTYLVTDDNGCTDTVTINVIPNNVPEISSEGTSVCVGQTLPMGIDATGGTWSTSSGALATISSTGVLLGRAAGVVGVTYTLPSGCFSAVQITVYPLSPIVGGAAVMCQGTTMTVSTATPGTGSWSTDDVDVAVASGTFNTAVIYGTGGGTTVIHYMSDAGCITSRTITVNPMAMLEMSSNVCVGQTTTAFADISGGTWISLNSAIATINGAGVITGVNAGTATIRYMLPTGCYTDMSITVNALSPIMPAGVLTLCQGSSMTVTNSTPSGSSWYGGSPFVSISGSGSSAVVTGESAGTAVITFFGNGCTTTKSVTVKASAMIEGPTTVCVGQAIMLTDTVAGGVWSSSSAALATVSTTGRVTGVAAGNVTIMYTVNGCIRSHVVTVYPLLATAPGGVSNICQGQTLTLTNATATASSWFSGDPAVATLTYSGGTATVYGAGGGNTTIIFMSNMGCMYTKSITVRAGAPIQGPSSVCVGQTIALSDSVTGGTWSSSAATLATVGLNTGIVTGVGAGNVTINYTLSGGCNYTKVINVKALSPITPTTAPAICAGQTITLANGTAGGGAWNSGNTEVAVINSSTTTSAVVGGIATGTALISFTSTAGCVTTRSVTVSAGAPITGPSSVCVGQTITLSNPAPGGTWSSSMLSTATVGAGTGIVTGAIAGNVNILYTLPGGCNYSKAITVNALNVITPTNVQTVCVGRSIILNNATPGIGSWSTSNTEVATLAAGTSTTYTTVWGVSAGTVVISYTSAAGCITTRSVNVVAASPVLGLSSVCVGQTIAMSNATGGGTWSSTSASVATVGVGTGIVTGVTAGNTNIVYTYPSGCSYSLAVTVNALNAITPNPAPAICAGQTLTLANGTAGGGAWSSSNTEVAVINSSTTTSAVVGGMTTGTALISFTSTAGCITTRSVTVSAGAPITGPSSVCVGQTIALSNPAPGGTWSSSMLSTATVGAGTGIVTGAIAGTVNIIYTLPGGCNYSKAITVNALNVITPTNVQTVCVGRSIILNNATPGIGSWSTSNTEVATLAAGTSTTYTTVWGVSAGTVVISYTSAAGCITTRSVNVVAASPVLGPSSVCVGQTIAMSNATGGGTWSSTSASVATVGVGTGIVTGVTAGNTNIVYTYPSGCSYSLAVTVNALNAILPNPAPAICAGQTLTLANSTAGGGAWSSSNTEVAVINSSTTTSAVVGGMTTGTALISFTSTAGCITTRSVTVSSGAPITGPSSVCVGQTIALSNAAAGGTWSSSMLSTATVGVGTGIVTGAIAGTVNIIYTLPGGCNYSKAITVNALNVITPTNTQTVCVGRSIILNNATPGIGAWSSSNTEVATLGTGTSSTYITVWGASAGTVTISYTSAAGCVTTRDVIITNASPILGLSAVCVGQTITLSNATGGGTWSSSTASVATIGITSGVVTGVAGGNATILYTYPSGCSYTMLLTVNALASIQPGGTPAVCEGRTTTFTNGTAGGGVWTAANPGTADVISQTSTSAVIQGMSAGTGVISFTSNVGGCVTTRTITVNATATISGAATICTGETLQLSTNIGGGTWSTSAVAIATVNASGLLTANGGGNVGITYTLAGGCNITMTMTVNPAATLTPAGSLTICQGQFINMTNNVPGGIWATDAPAVATLNVTSATTAQVWGAGPGSTTITYTTAAGCVTTKNVTTVAGPTIIVPSTVCVGQTITLALGQGPTNGTWYSGADAIATVSPTGLIMGRGEGTVTIYNILPGGCNSSAQVTVLPLSPITGGVSTLCLGNVMLLANATGGGGVWNTNNGAIADVQSSTTSTATIVATGTGSTEITFTAVNGCIATRSVTVAVCRPTGIVNNNVSGYDVHVFPNPTSGVLTLQGELGIQTDEEVSIQVVDMTGRIILTDNTTARNGVVNKQIDVTNKTANGMYILSIRFAGQQKLYHFTVQN